MPALPLPPIPTPADIDAAAARIAPHVLETPLWRVPSAALGLPAGTPAFEVWLKLEHLQRGGSFKARGMFNRLLANRLPAAGAIVASGGNAGIATAVAARALGVPAEVFVPEVCPAPKRERLAALGARVVVGGAAYADALQACIARLRETGALMTHAYDQPEVVAGAGTLARELEAQLALPPASQPGRPRARRPRRARRARGRPRRSRCRRCRPRRRSRRPSGSGSRAGG